MQSELWQEIPEFDGAGVEQKWIEGNTGYNLRVLHWTPKNEDYKQARTLVMIPGYSCLLNRKPRKLYCCHTHTLSKLQRN